MLEIVPFSPPHFVCNSVMPTYFFGYMLSYVSIPGLASAHSTEVYRLWLHGVYMYVCALCIFVSVCVHVCMSFLCVLHWSCMCLAWSFIPFGGKACALTKTLIAYLCMHACTSPGGALCSLSGKGPPTTGRFVARFQDKAWVQPFAWSENMWVHNTHIHVPWEIVRWCCFVDGSVGLLSCGCGGLAGRHPSCNILCTCYSEIAGPPKKKSVQP